MAHFFAKLIKIRLILNIHAYVKEEGKYVYNNIIGRLYICVVQAIFSLSVKLADGIIFNHPDLQKYITHRHSYKGPTEFIYNGANTSRFYPVGKCKARRALSISKDKTILLFLGSAAKWHGVDCLVEMASVLQAKSDDSLIYIVGGHSASKEYMESLAATAPKNVIFTGKVDIDLANLYINASDICLLPVKKIRVSPGSPRKLFDYIAVGRPVVTQEATTGYSDIVLSYELGYTVDFHESHVAAERIMAIVSECHKKDYEIHNRQVALTSLNWRNVSKEWSSFIDKITNMV
jgi:glycosyltransferase involved in cell wall biosynthesis